MKVAGMRVMEVRVMEMRVMGMRVMEVRLMGMRVMKMRVMGMRVMEVRGKVLFTLEGQDESAREPENAVLQSLSLGPNLALWE